MSNSKTSKTSKHHPMAVSEAGPPHSKLKGNPPNTGSSFRDLCQSVLPRPVVLFGLATSCCAQSRPQMLFADGLQPTSDGLRSDHMLLFLGQFSDKLEPNSTENPSAALMATISSTRACSLRLGGKRIAARSGAFSTTKYHVRMQQSGFLAFGLIAFGTESMASSQR